MKNPLSETLNNVVTNFERFENSRQTGGSFFTDIWRLQIAYPTAGPQQLGFDTYVS